VVHGLYRFFKAPAGKMASPVELLLNTVDLLTTGSRELKLTAVVIVTCSSNLRIKMETTNGLRNPRKSFRKNT